MGKSDSTAANSFAGEHGRKVGLGVDTLEEIPWIVRWVWASTRRQWVMSTRRWKWARKSAPRMGFSTSATTNTNRKVRRSPRSTLRERVPWVAKGVPLTAWRVKLLLGRLG